MKHVGFTGTRAGLTQAQLETLRAAMGEITAPATLHSGDCKGADAEAHAIACRLGWRNHGHPCNLRSMRAWCKFDVTEEAIAPLDRNRIIVDCCGVLIACPAGMAEELRSGTWATCRYCRKAGKPLIIVWPDGSVTRENEPT